MFDTMTELFSAAFAEVVVILVGAGLAYLGSKANKVLTVLRQKDQFGIVDSFTDYAVEYAEAELKGKKGIEKRNFAIHKAVELLAEQNIRVSREHIIAGVENGVNKLRERQAISKL